MSMEIWFRASHASVADNIYTAPVIEECWHIVVAGDKYGLDISLLEDWFAL